MGRKATSSALRYMFCLCAFRDFLKRSKEHSQDWLCYCRLTQKLKWRQRVGRTKQLAILPKIIIATSHAESTGPKVRPDESIWRTARTRAGKLWFEEEFDRDGDVSGDGFSAAGGWFVSVLLERCHGGAL